MCGAVIDGLSEKVKEGISLLCVFFFSDCRGRIVLWWGRKKVFLGRKGKKIFLLQKNQMLTNIHLLIQC